MLHGHLPIPSAPVDLIGEIRSETGADVVREELRGHLRHQMYVKAFIHSATETRAKLWRILHKITNFLLSTTTTVKEPQIHLYAIIETAVMTEGRFGPVGLVEKSPSSAIDDSAVIVEHKPMHRHFAGLHSLGDDIRLGPHSIGPAQQRASFTGRPGTFASLPGALVSKAA